MQSQNQVYDLILIPVYGLLIVPLGFFVETTKAKRDLILRLEKADTLQGFSIICLFMAVKWHKVSRNKDEKTLG